MKTAIWILIILFAINGILSARNRHNRMLAAWDAQDAVWNAMSKNIDPNASIIIHTGTFQDSAQESKKEQK